MTHGAQLHSDRRRIEPGFDEATRRWSLPILPIMEVPAQ